MKKTWWALTWASEVADQRSGPCQASRIVLPAVTFWPAARGCRLSSPGQPAAFFWSAAGGCRLPSSGRQRRAAGCPYLGLLGPSFKDLGFSSLGSSGFWLNRYINNFFFFFFYFIDQMIIYLIS